MSTNSATPNALIETRTELTYIANTFIRKTEEGYEYFRLKLATPVGNFAEIEKRPPVVDDGYICYKGTVIEVKANELIKGKVNVTRVTNAGVSRTITASSTITDTLEGRDGAIIKQGFDSKDEIQVGKDIDLAWAQQVGELLYNEDPQAEWEIVEDASQPEQADANSPVQVAEPITEPS